MSETTNNTRIVNTRIVNTRIQHKHDTAANWTKNDPTLLDGELGIESDTGRMKVGKLVDGKHVKWTDLVYTDVYSNDTPIITEIGSIKPGTTFKNVSIQEMLTKILYPYIKIEFGGTQIEPNISEAFPIQSLPTIESVTLFVNKNSATNIDFTLCEDLGNNTRNTIAELGDTDIINNKVVFNNLSHQVNTTRDLLIVCSYTGEYESKRESVAIELGTIRIKFEDPEITSITHDLDKTSYFNGQSDVVDTITANLELNSAGFDIFKITKISLSKFIKNASGTYVKDGDSIVVSNPDLDYTNSYSFENLDTELTKTTKYEVTAEYLKRDGDNTNAYTASISKYFEIPFSRKPATINLQGATGGTFSKLEPKNISGSSLTAKFVGHSDIITNVQLFVKENNVETSVETKRVDDLNTGKYNPDEKERTFLYSKNNICSNLTLTAKAYNEYNEGTLMAEDTTPIKFTFYAPYCYGFVDNDITFAKVDRNVLNSLMSKKASMTTHVKESSKGYKKFIYAIPNGNYTSAKDSNGNGDENWPFFENNENIADTKKEIEFADGSKVMYQILIFSSPTGNDIDLYFR